MGVTRAVSSDSAPLRHMEVRAYRCSLPGLTGFTRFHCAGPSRQHHLHGAGPTETKPREGIQPCYSGLQVQGTAISPSSTAKSVRRGWDSNPRDGYPPTRSPGVLLQPDSDTSPSLHPTVSPLSRHTGGEGGIRTHGSLAGTRHFECRAINRTRPPLRIIN